MTPHAVAISADTPLPEATKIIHDDKKIHRLPVVDENHHPSGIITESDIVCAIAAV